MNKQSKILCALLFAVTTMIAGCGGPTTTPTGGSNTNGGNLNGVNTTANANSALEPTPKPESATTNDAPTLGPVVRSYYDALKKKDDALLRSVLSADFIKETEAEMKEEKQTGLAAYMAKYDTIPEKPVEVRNERIDGSKGVAEVKGGVYLNWTPLDFVNEGGKWKLTGGSPVLK